MPSLTDASKMAFHFSFWSSRVGVRGALARAVTDTAMVVANWLGFVFGSCSKRVAPPRRTMTWKKKSRTRHPTKKGNFCLFKMEQSDKKNNPEGTLPSTKYVTSTAPNPFPFVLGVKVDAHRGDAMDLLHLGRECVGWVWRSGDGSLLGLRQTRRRRLVPTKPATTISPCGSDHWMEHTCVCLLRGL